MPQVPTVTADGVKICQLARERYGTVLAFGAAIGRHPRSVSNLQHKRRVLSLKFAEQIAEGLGVPLSEITAPGQEEPRQTARAL